jgi:tetratricopeptide (TPR) repeat protein
VGKINSLLFFVAVLLTCGSAKGASDFDFTPSLLSAYSDIQKLRLEKAADVLRNEGAKPVANGFLTYLESYSDFFYFLISDDQKDYSNFNKRQEARLQQLAKLSPSSPYQRMMMAEVRLHSAFVKLKFGSRANGCWDIVKANKLLEENRKLFPDFVPHLKALGLLHAMIGSVPEEYQWVARLMGLRGSIRQGLAELKRVEQEDGVFAKEAEITSLLLHAYILQPDEQMLRQLKQLPYREPDNLLFHFLSASILMKKGESEAAESILNKAPQREGYLPFPFLHYMKGEVYLQKGRYDQANAEFASFLKKTKGSNFVKDSYFKQYLCLWLPGSVVDNTLLSRVLSSGSLNVEADKHAEKVAQRMSAGKINPEQRVLFEARYAFDGGFLSRAIGALRGKEEKSFALLASRIEYNYRMGRILQLQGEKNTSIAYLKRAVTLSQGQDYYFGPSAALQLGYIYRDSGKSKEAADHFRTALSFKKHEYKNSIDNKARAAMTEMGEK